jgi:hypothetical protein
MQAHPELACASVDSRLSFGSRMRETDARLRNIICFYRRNSSKHFVVCKYCEISFNFYKLYYICQYNIRYTNCAFRALFDHNS